MKLINVEIINVKVDNLNRIKKVMILLVIGILIPIFLSGCVNPMEKVPVMKIDIAYTERQGIAEPDSHSFTQDNVSYIDKPKRTQAQSFPAIVGRTTVIKKVIKNDAKFNGTVIGPWEAVPYKGNGSYTFYVGFYDGGYPESGDTIHVSVMVVDNTGQRIGYITEDEIWK